MTAIVFAWSSFFEVLERLAADGPPKVLMGARHSEHFEAQLHFKGRFLGKTAPDVWDCEIMTRDPPL